MQKVLHILVTLGMAVLLAGPLFARAYVVAPTHSLQPIPKTAHANISGNIAASTTPASGVVNRSDTTAQPGSISIANAPFAKTASEPSHGWGGLEWEALAASVVLVVALVGASIIHRRYAAASSEAN